MGNQRELDFQKLVERTHEIAISSLKNFFALLDLDPELFKHLYNIEIDFDEEENLATYSPIDNKVSLNKEEYENALDEIEYNEYKRQQLELNLACCIVHELIHANRTVLIDNTVNILNVDKVKSEELIKYIQGQQGYDLDRLNLSLSEILYKPYVNEFNDYIPCEIKENDGNFDVFAYNRKTKNYELFSSSDFNDDFSEDKDKFLLSVGKKINTSIYEIKDTVYSFTDNSQRPIVACDYIHGYNGFFKNEDLSLSLDEYRFNLFTEFEEMEDKLDGQGALEETLTESFALIAIMSRNDKTLDLDIITKKMEEQEESIDIVVAAKLIRTLGKDFVKWFMTVAYEPYYEDKLSKTFTDKYDSLLLDFYNLYQASINEENDVKSNEAEINDVDRIIKQKVLKRR